MGAVGFLAGGAAGNLPDAAIRMLKIALGNCRRLGHNRQRHLGY